MHCSAAAAADRGAEGENGDGTESTIGEWRVFVVPFIDFPLFHELVLPIVQSVMIAPLFVRCCRYRSGNIASGSILGDFPRWSGSQHSESEFEGVR